MDLTTMKSSEVITIVLCLLLITAATRFAGAWFAIETMVMIGIVWYTARTIKKI